MTTDHLAESNIVKIDEDQQLVFGWANVIADVNGRTVLDRQTDFIDTADELEKSAYDYVLHCRDGGEMHVRKGVATMVESMVFTQEKQDALGVPKGTMPVGWWLGFKVNDDAVWAEVKKGEYMGFSVHGKGRRERVDIDLDEFTHEQPIRKMHGAEWPSSAFAYVPDPSKPATWRLRTWEDIEKKWTPRSVSRAIAAWSRSGLEHNHTAKEGLAKAWREVHPEAPMPKELETMTEFDQKRILLKARTAMAISKHASHKQKSHGNWASGGSGAGTETRRGSAKSTDAKGRHVSVGDVLAGSQGRYQIDAIEDNGKTAVVHDAKTGKKSTMRMNDFEIEPNGMEESARAQGDPKSIDNRRARARGGLYQNGGEVGGSLDPQNAEGKSLGQPTLPGMNSWDKKKA